MTGWLILSTAVLFWVVLQANAQETIPYQVYLARISRYRTQIQGPTSCETFNKIADELEGITAVQMPDGSIMAVAHVGADQALRQSCHVGAADRYLAGLCPANLCKPGQPQLTQPPDQPQPSGSLGDFSQNNDNIPEINPDTGMPQPSADNNQPQDPTGETGSPASAEGGSQTLPDNNTEAASEAPGAENPGATNPDANSSEGVAESSSEDPAGGEAAPAGGNEAADEGASLGETPADSLPAGEAGAGEQPGGETAPNTAGENGTAGEESNLGESATDSSAGESPGGENGAAPAPAENGENSAVTPTEPPPPELAPEVAIQAPVSRRTLLIIGIVAVLLVLIIIVLSIFFIRSRTKEEEDTAKKQRRPKPSPAVRKELDEGRKKVQQGEYREAVRKLFLAALITLDEQGALQYDATLTNMELLRGAGIRPSLIPPLTPVINTYERVWYGYEPLQPTEYESLVTQIQQLRQSDEERVMRDE